MIKMFASDLDGTLLNALHEADGTIRRAIRELTEAGLHVVPATGRSTLPIGEHGFTGLALDACCSNGSIVRDSHGEVLKTWTIDPQVTEELLKAFPDICFDCSTPDGMYSSGSFEMHQAGFKKDSPIKRIVMRGMRARGGYHEEQYFDQSIGDILRHDVCKINCRVTSPEATTVLPRTRSRSTATAATTSPCSSVSATAMRPKTLAMQLRLLRAQLSAAAWSTPSPNTCSPPCISRAPAPSLNNVTKGLSLCHSGD